MADESHPCLYCGAPDSSDEHVISEALGCREEIKNGICATCNNTFGHSFEANFINALALFLNFFKIANGDGVVPGVAVTGKLGSEEFRFVITGEGKAKIHPQRLRDARTAFGHEREFRIFFKGEETKIGEVMRSRHPDLTWTRSRSSEDQQIIDVQAEFDAEFLANDETNRTVAKYALNLLIHQFGYDWVRSRFQSLIDYIKGDQSRTTSGVFWDPILLERFPFTPPKHLFVIVCDSKTHTVTVFLSLFCLFPFCVASEEPGVQVDSFKSGAIDPYRGRITPLFLEGEPRMLERSLLPFPMPEFAFAETLQSTEKGTLRQAKSVSSNAVRFIQAVYSETLGMPHICYNSKRILAQLTSTCEHCGKSPLPDPAVVST